MAYQKQNIFTTRNVALASVLTLKGYELVEIQFGANDNPFFKFNQSDEIAVISDEFYAGKSCVEPKSFSFELRNLKRMVFEQRKEHSG